MLVHFASGVLRLEMRGEVGPDPMQWSVADVVSYFITAGFPEQAVAFKTQVLFLSPMRFPLLSPLGGATHSMTAWQPFAIDAPFSNEVLNCIPSYSHSAILEINDKHN